MSDISLDEFLATQDKQASHITLGDIYSALVEARGNRSEAARNLGIRRPILSAKIDANPTLLALCQDLRESITDKAETNIFNEVERGDQSASRFVLSTLGKDRGYVQSVAGQGKNGEIEISIRTFAPEPPNGTD